jgi:hypothetical protein
MKKCIHGEVQQLLLKIQKLKHTTLMQPVVLYACGTWSLALTIREEHTQMVFENKDAKVST